MLSDEAEVKFLLLLSVRTKNGATGLVCNVGGGLPKVTQHISGRTRITCRPLYSQVSDLSMDYPASTN